MYGGMTLAGKFLCDAAGVDVSGGFRLDAEDFFSAWLFALVPIFGALVVHQVRFWSLVSGSGSGLGPGSGPCSGSGLGSDSDSGSGHC